MKASININVWKLKASVSKEKQHGLMCGKHGASVRGHHRATALAIAAKEGRDISFSQLPSIALTQFNKSEVTLLDNILARGSERNPRK